MEDYIFKVADQDWEFEEIHKLNYQSFVEEIPQHDKNSDEKLIDQFHAENSYVVCLKGEQLLGMIAYRNRRPYSLDAKLDDLDSYLPQGRRVCEIRLLAVVSEYRYSNISLALVYKLINYSLDLGSDLAIFSGTVRQAKLYGHIGAVPFGPLVGSSDAQYQPMYLTDEAFSEVANSSRFLTKISPELDGNGGLSFNFLPGPVALSARVKKACSSDPSSHRSAEFVRDFQSVQKVLCELVNARYVQIMMGPGTVANDAIAAQLALLPGRGLILVNGEFSRRLVNYARGAKLSYETLEVSEGDAFSVEAIGKVLRNKDDISWLWAVHCETSTGALNDVKELQGICEKHDVKLCLDCISSIGIIPVDLGGVYLASDTSGKGLVSVSGLAMVFHNHDLCSTPDAIPNSLDVGYYQDKGGIPFTLQSNLLYALSESLAELDWAERYKKIEAWSISTRKLLARAGLSTLVDESSSLPAVITVVVPAGISSADIGDELKERDILVSYKSSYLLERNWIQFCMMGNDQQSARKSVRILKRLLIA